MLPRTSIRHSRFSNTLLIEDILQQIESILRRIEQRNIENAEAQLHVAVSHIMRLERYFPAQEHAQILTGLQTVLTELQRCHLSDRGVSTCQNNRTRAQNGTRVVKFFVNTFNAGHS